MTALKTARIFLVWIGSKDCTLIDISTLREILVPIPIILTRQISILFRLKAWFAADDNFSSNSKEQAIRLTDGMWLRIYSTSGVNANRNFLFYGLQTIGC